MAMPDMVADMDPALDTRRIKFANSPARSPQPQPSLLPARRTHAREHAAGQQASAHREA